jgi:aminoglycoside phosphotransferase (APT) family kinase protein
MPRLLAEAQSRLHALPAASIAARLTQRGVEPAEVSLGALLADLDSLLRALDSRELRDDFDRLVTRRREERELVLCHGDVHAENLVVDRDGEWTLIDWTNARLAEPELDVAFAAELLELAPLRTPRALRPLVRALGARSSRSFRARYAGPSALDPERVEWYRALYRLQLLARVEADELGESHPYRFVAPLARERLSRALRA